MAGTSRVTKADLIGLIRRKAEKTYTKAEVADIYDSLCEVIEDEICNGNSITLQGIGHFDLFYRPAKVGRNPATGESIDVPEKVGIAFKVTKSLKDKASELDPDDFRPDTNAKAAEKTRNKKTEPAKPARRNKR